MVVGLKTSCTSSGDVETAAIIGWSGYGEFRDLERSVSSKLSLDTVSLTAGARSLTVLHEDPVAVARRLAYLPGVSWISVGYHFDGRKAWASALQLLAKRYLQRGSSFSLTAQVERSDIEEGDVLLEGNGAVLKSVKGSKVDEKDPDISFRIVMVGNSGVVGVELRGGPGGVPTSRGNRVHCLVSGGYHSSVVSWMTALSGFSLTLVHARADDESLRQVARLYAELSRRIDSSSLRLLVLDGTGTPGERLSTWLDVASGEIIAGIHPECRGVRQRGVLRGHPFVLLPLLLIQEDEVKFRLDSLGMKVKRVDHLPTLSFTGSKKPYVVRTFGRTESDINGVLDGLLG